MDVILQTHTLDPMFGLFGVSKFAYGSGYLASLRVNSRGFMLERPFYFDEHGLFLFVTALNLMDGVLAGSAELRTPYEDHFVRLDVGSRGQVAVSGEVREYSDFDQRIRFGFETDQTVLGPFARDLDTVLHLVT